MKLEVKNKNQSTVDCPMCSLEIAVHNCEKCDYNEDVYTSLVDDECKYVLCNYGKKDQVYWCQSKDMGY